MTECLHLLLKPAALLYSGMVQLRNLGFETKLLQSWRAPLPVVSIGNITAGGTGKTPLADWIINYYLSTGERPALLSRGYGRTTKGVQLVSDGRRLLCSSREAGDETAMLAAKNPSIIVVAAEKRKAGVKFILQEFPDRMPTVIILDDGFQHRQISRDLDIVVVNAGERYFKARMLPEGRLREPACNIHRADIVVLGKITDRSTAEKIAGDLEGTGLPVVRARTGAGELVGLEGVPVTDKSEGMRAFAFAGIGSPEGFLDSLKEKGVRVEAHRFFRDHEPYTREKLLPVLQESGKKGLIPVTTEKDYFRLQGTPELCRLLAAQACCYLKISTEFIEGREILETMLQAAISQGKRKA